MKIRRRAEIEIHTETRSVFRTEPDVEHYTECRFCDKQTVRMLTPDEAGRFVHVSSRRIYRLLEAGRLHFREMPNGTILVCLESLLSWASDGRKSRSD